MVNFLAQVSCLWVLLCLPGLIVVTSHLILENLFHVDSFKQELVKVNETEIACYENKDEYYDIVQASRFWIEGNWWIYYIWKILNIFSSFRNDIHFLMFYIRYRCICGWNIWYSRKYCNNTCLKTKETTLHYMWLLCILWWKGCWRESQQPRQQLVKK